jgi:hypothetical protein
LPEMELRLPPDARAPATVACSGCGETIYEDKEQTARWGYWSDGVGDLYPHCIECATRRVRARRSRERASAYRSFVACVPASLRDEDVGYNGPSQAIRYV